MLHIELMTSDTVSKDFKIYFLTCNSPFQINNPVSMIWVALHPFYWHYGISQYFCSVRCFCEVSHHQWHITLPEIPQYHLQTWTSDYTVPFLGHQLECWTKIKPLLISGDSCSLFVLYPLSSYLIKPWKHLFSKPTAS